MYFINDTSLVYYDLTVKKEYKHLLNKRDYQLLDKLTKYANGEISAKKGKIEDIVTLLSNETFFVFTVSLLFSNIQNKYEVIQKYTEISINTIKQFEKLFFNQTLLKGKLGKISLFKKLLRSEDKDLRNIGVVLKSVHIFGHHYILWKFALNTAYDGVETSMYNTFKDMYFNYIEKSFENVDDLDAHLRNGKLLISAAAEIQKIALASQTNNSSTIDEIKEYLLKLNEDLKTDENMIELDIIDVDEIEQETEENKEQ